LNPIFCANFTTLDWLTPASPASCCELRWRV
jgi:hypothetical protein